MPVAGPHVAGAVDRHASPQPGMDRMRRVRQRGVAPRPDRRQTELSRQSPNPASPHRRAPRASATCRRRLPYIGYWVKSPSICRSSAHWRATDSGLLRSIIARVSAAGTLRAAQPKVPFYLQLADLPIQLVDLLLLLASVFFAPRSNESPARLTNSRFEVLIIVRCTRTRPTTPLSPSPRSVPPSRPAP